MNTRRAAPTVRSEVLIFLEDRGCDGECDWGVVLKTLRRIDCTKKVVFRDDEILAANRPISVPM